MAMVFMVVIVSIAAASGESEKSGEAKSFVLKYNQLENEEHPQGVIETKFAEKIEELSNGQIKVETY